MNTTSQPISENEVTFLAQIVGNENGQPPVELVRSILDINTNENGGLPAALARSILELSISERHKARMHDLAVRNQDDELTPVEKEEMFAFAKAATLLSLLKSRARRVLGIKLEKRTVI